MTREDAITILDCERPYGSCGCGATDEEIEEALDMAIKALEQKPICPSAGIDCEDCPAYEKKSEWQHDHEILKAYSDGASAVLDNVRAEIDGLLNDEDSNMYAHGVMDCLEIIDKFMAEGSGEE